MANTMTTRIEKLQAKSEKCWALACDPGATEAERNAAASRCLHLDAEVGKLLVAARRAA